MKGCKKNLPDVWVDKVAEVSGIDALDVLHVDCCQVVIVLACFLSGNDNNDQ